MASKVGWGLVAGIVVGGAALAWFGINKAKAAEAVAPAPAPVLDPGHDFTWTIGAGLSASDRDGLVAWMQGAGKPEMLEATERCFGKTAEYRGTTVKDAGDGTFDVQMVFHYTGPSIDTNTLKACLDNAL